MPTTPPPPTTTLLTNNTTLPATHNDLVSLSTFNKSRMMNGVSCPVCNVSLTSTMIYETHVNGARHRKNVLKLSALGVEVKDGEPVPLVTPFTAAEAATSSLLAVEQPTPPPTQQQTATDAPSQTNTTQDTAYVEPPSTAVTAVKLNTPFRCEICQLCFTSDSQLVMHEAGKKHAKKLAALGFVADQQPTNKTQETIDARALQPKSENFQPEQHHDQQNDAQSMFDSVVLLDPSSSSSSSSSSHIYVAFRNE